MKKIKVVIIILILLMMGYIVLNTYSKYNDEASARIQQDIGRWNIKINDTDITSVTGEPVEFEIDNFEWNVSQHVKEGKVAPGMKGAFELTIDPKDTDVSVQYSIIIDQALLVASNDINLKITKITVNGEEYNFNVPNGSGGTGNVVDGNTISGNTVLDNTVTGNVVVGNEVSGNTVSGGTTGGANSEIELKIVKPLAEVQSTNDDVRIDDIIVEVEWQNNEIYNAKDSEIGRVPNNIITLPISIDVIQYTGAEETTPEPEPDPGP